MNIQPAFDFTTYPNRPGYRDTDTSKEAAGEIESRAITLRSRALVLLTGEALTADEVAGRLSESQFTIRPRVTELFKLGLIEDSGLRRRNASGRNAIVWKAKG
jgi:predicted ArsR family transcriptional regulator